MTPATKLSLTFSLACTLAAQAHAQDAAPRIEWQRTLADALAVQQATGLPLLIAVNSAGEIFNDRFRTNTYKTPAFVEKTRGYVCIIASPDRHNERDHDALGNRIECPAFPGCTCGEHIAVEPELYERYFAGRRWAPRHIGIDSDGGKLFDRYQDRRMQTAIDAIEEHRGTPQPADIPTTAAELLRRRDAASRRALEDMYRAAETSERMRLLEAAGKADNEPYDLILLALQSEDADEFEAGARALAEVAGANALPRLEDALSRTRRHRDSLRAKIEQLARSDARAARLHAHFNGSDPSYAGPWRNRWAEAGYDPRSREALEAELDACERLLRETPGEQDSRLRLAMAQLAFAELLIATGGSGVEFWLEDAHSSATKVSDDDLVAEAQAVIAIACWLKNDPESAQTAAAAALSATAGNDREPTNWLATRLFEVVVQTASRAAYARANDPKAILQPEVARVADALSRLEDSAWSAEEAMLTGIGLLEYAGLRAEARRHLDAAVRRFQSSVTVHDRWRARVMADLGTEAMRAAAGALIEEARDAAAAEWFAGYAAIVAAEQHVRDDRSELAAIAYTDAVTRFLRAAAANPGYADSANHFAVLALAGRAHERHRAGEHEAAVADLQRCPQLREASLDSQDGIKRTPRGIATRVKQALEDSGESELAAQLRDIAL